MGLNLDPSACADGPDARPPRRAARPGAARSNAVCG